MTTPVSFHWHRYRYLPYEHRLAQREVEALLGVKPAEGEAGLTAVVRRVPAPALLSRLTYFREVRVNGATRVVPTQARLEASAAAVLRDDEVPSLSRQSTRYSAHGLHEYRGKFHPHMVRAVGNLFSLPEDAWILDPFCGSGTTLLEAAHAGWNALGVDCNPLGILVSRTKLAAVRVPISALMEETHDLIAALSRISQGIDFEVALTRAARKQLAEEPLRSALPNRDYLESWFTTSVLAQLECIQAHIERMSHAEARDIARVVLSDCLREVSLQDPADLRIRRRKDPEENYPAIPTFLTTLRARVEAVARARELLPGPRGVQDAILGDSRGSVPTAGARRGRGFDGIITSPPYATALPYIDTQRLSLAFLGLVRFPGIRTLEAELIGNREITQRQRVEAEAALRLESDGLPEDALALCRRAMELVSSPTDGFRRRNVPALLFRYFRDMRSVLRKTLEVVRPGGFLAALVGPSRTTLGGRELAVDTPALLSSIGEHAGWEQGETIPLDAYQRFALHRANSIRTEALVVLRKRRKA